MGAAIGGLVALVACEAVWFGGCCDPFRDESRTYWISAGPGPLSYEFSGEPAWSGTTSASNQAPSGYYVIVAVDREPSTEMIEIYDSAGRLDLTGTYRGDIANPHGCQFTGLVYDLSALPSGTYTLVHRRSTAPPGLRSLDSGWTTYDGEEALVTTLVVRTTAARDAGP